MTRRITSHTTLDNLKKEAKRWLKELRLDNPEARARFNRVHPRAPGEPTLRDVQHALALEFELAGWNALKQALDTRAPGEVHVEETPDELVRRFLHYACPDHHVRGRPAHRMAYHAAMRMLNQHPEIARDSIYTAVVCGEVEEVQRILREPPESANEKSSDTSPDRSGAGESGDIFKDIGPKGWPPLLYLCFTRLPLDKANVNAVAIASMLLDHGADPNAYFMAGNSHYTPLTGVVGEGEEDRPPHPQREALARLLLERGAEPFDSQVTYNIHFHGKVLWFLELMYEFSVKAGRKAEWDNSEWPMLDMGGYGSGARWYLSLAVQNNDLALAEWCLDHGASANAPPPPTAPLSQRTLYQDALRLGQTAMADLLLRRGARRETVPLEGDFGEDAFVAACFRCDRPAAQALLAQHPEFLGSWQTMHIAAEHDREDVVQFLIDLGMSPDVEDPRRRGYRPLHVAARKGARHVATLLIKRGARIDPMFHGDTPLFFAMGAEQSELISLLSRYSRDVWALSFTGYVERVREVLRAEPEIATGAEESTPLFWLPEDEAKALELVELFLNAGVDTSFRRQEDGMTAAQVARRRGLNRVADRLSDLEAGPPDKASKVAAPVSADVAKYDSLARDMVNAYGSDNAEAMQRLNEHFGRSATVDDLRAAVWGMLYKVRQAGGSSEAFGIAEAQEVIARTSGFPNWTLLQEAAAKGAPPAGNAYRIDKKENKIAPNRNPSAGDWDAIIGLMKEQRITALEAHGFMNDGLLKRIADLDFVTRLSLEGAREMSDEGLQHIARMPQLQDLNLTGCKVSDRGLAVLRQLPELRRFEMNWQRGISDAGISNLKDCHKLESVDLMGSATGDGAIQALRGKPNLRSFSTGKGVTDEGLAMLHDFPLFKAWHGGDVPADAENATHLLIDGPFTNAGLASLAGLEGILDLDLFWHVTGITSDGFAHLALLSNLGSLGCDGKLSDDAAMRHIAALPRLRRLRVQESVATDDGFIALSHSRTIEEIWGRDCPNFSSRGFVALSKMPVLRAFGIGCQNVDDHALATLSHFPALRELTPIGVRDDGFRHIGRCEQLERLVCMYCRDTTDIATEHIAGLRLKSYYAGLTQITDRSLEILGRMTSLEGIEFFETKAVTDAGLAHLAGLPRLLTLDLAGLPNVTLQGIKVFPARVQVNYNV